MDTEMVDLVRRARDGDAAAWECLVTRFRGLIAAIARSFRLSPSDTADIAQTTWLRLFESIDRVRDPQRLAGWLATTARRECLRVLRSTTREFPGDEVDRGLESYCYDAPDEQLLGEEERTTVRAAVGALPDGHRRLLQVLLAEPPPSYMAVAETLDMPVGSIGPTRGRAIEQLRQDPQILALAS